MSTHFPSLRGLNVTINRHILEASRQYIPNLSHFFEKKLEEFLTYVNHPLTRNYEWARPDSNRGSPPCQSFNRVKNSLKIISGDIIKEYLDYRFSKLRSEKSKWWIQKTVEELMRHTKGKLSREKLMKFQNWYKQKYEFEGQSKFHSNTKNFLEWLYKRTGEDEFRKLQEILETPTKPSKKLNQILIREGDVKNLINALWESEEYSYYQKLKYTTAILFGAYTGQRPMSTMSRLTKEELEEAINRDPPLIYISEEKDKESFPHWVPLHPTLVQWLRKYLEVMDPQTEYLFAYPKIRKIFRKLNVKAIHTGKRITISHLRKFFEQMCNNVLMVHPGLRDYIMAHNTGSLDVQSYDGKLPSEIYEQYMKKWRDVDLVPEEVKLEGLVRLCEQC